MSMNVKDAGVAFYGATNKHNEINSDNENVQGKKKVWQIFLSFNRKNKWKIKYETSDPTSTDLKNKTTTERTHNYIF